MNIKATQRILDNMKTVQEKIQRDMAQSADLKARTEATLKNIQEE